MGLFSSKTPSWHKIAESPAELFQADLITREVNGKLLCFARHNGSIFAFPDKCPHAGGSLSHGYVDAIGNIVCPLHRYKFMMKNGYNSSGEGYFLKTYKVRVDEEGVWVEL